MAVEPEEILHPFASGSVKVPRIVRHPNGDWSVEFEINFRVKIDDTRDVHVTDRHVMVRGTQRGRKAFTPALVSALAADETSAPRKQPTIDLERCAKHYRRKCASCGKYGDASTPEGVGIYYCSHACAD